MADSDSEPLLDDADEALSTAVDFTNMVFFYGKEMKSTPQSGIFRIGVSKEGVFKLHNEENRVLAHWKYSDISDWTFSGYSFSLTTKGNKHHYIRTDDGESLCKYIEAFSKNPEHAMEMAALNPHMPRFPDSAVKSLSKKFSSAVSADVAAGAPPSSSDGVKFYTLTRKPRTTIDGMTKSVQHMNVDVDSRLNSSSSPSSLPPGDARRTHTDPLKALLLRNAMDNNDTQSKSLSVPPPFREKSLSLSEGSPRYSNGFSHEHEGPLPPSHSDVGRPKSQSPPQARAQVGGVGGGEGVKRHSRSAALLPPPTVEAPDLIDLTSPPPTTEDASRLTSSSSSSPSMGGQKVKGSKTAANVLWSRRTSEGREPPHLADPPPTTTTTTTAAAAKQPEPSISWKSSTLPPSLTKDETSGSLDSNDRSSCSDSEHGSPARMSIPSGPLGGSTQQIPTHVTPANRSSADCFSYESEDASYDKLLSSIGALGAKMGVGTSPTSSSCSSDLNDQQHLAPPSPSSSLESPIHRHHAQHLTAPALESPLHRSHQMTPTSASSSPHKRSNVYEEVLPQAERKREHGGVSFLRPGSHSPEDSNNYDHLPESRGDSPAHSITPPPPLQSYSFMDRNISQPVLRSKVPVSPQTSGGAERPSMVPEEEGEEVGAGEGSVSSLDQEPAVILRSKPKAPAPDPTPDPAEEQDPFEEIMKRPSATSRLRWSQELNPLYDYFKGAKFTQKMASLDYVLYETPQEDSTSSGVTSPLIQKEEGVLPPGGEEEEEEEGVESIASHEGGEEVAMTTEPVAVDGEALIPEATPHNTLPRPPKRSHMYEDVSLSSNHVDRPRSYVGGVRHQSDGATSLGVEQVTMRHAEATPTVPIANPHIGKRQIMLNQRRSRTIGTLDDIATTKRKQKPLKAADNMKDFSYVMREFRVFYIQMPNGCLLSDVINITRPVSEVIEKLCYYLGVDDHEVYVLYLTGSCLTSLKETGVDGGDAAAIHFKVNRKGSFIHLVDHQALPDQGPEQILLKNNLSLKMQGITTSRILQLQREQDIEWPVLNITLSPEDEFNKCWLSIVQGNTPCSMEQAVKLAAIQHQAYVQHRTAMNSTVAFCRPIDFLPVEYAGVRGIDQKMYKEQETMNLKAEKDIYLTYKNCYTSLPTHDTIFFPAREPRRKLLHSTKLKPILIGVNSKGVLRVDHKTKEILDMWDYQVLKNWAYSKRTFVLAFANKNYPMESIQAKWISSLVDFHVDSIMDSAANLGKLIADSDQ